MCGLVRVGPACTVAVMKNTYTGRCLCGDVTYVANGPPVVVAQCHCEECRRLSGTGHTIGAMFAAEAVTLHGNLGTFRYKSGKNADVTKAFCAACGSPILGTSSRTPGHVTLPLGTMDNADGLEVQVVIFERDRPHWDCLGEEVIVFRTQPDWDPDDRAG